MKPLDPMLKGTIVCFTLAIVFALMGIASNACGQPVDEFPFSRSVIVNSPGDVKTWPITSAITSVKFSPGVGWIADFDKRKGAGSWGTYVTPGWDGGLQYTLGLCRRTGTYWTCSMVVEFWWNRIEEEGPKSHAPPDRIAQEWFYDARWGELYGWQPAYGEEVGVVIVAGDCRNVSEVPGGAIKQRTAARLLKWGVDIGPAVSPSPVPPEEPAPSPTPTPVPTPAPPTPSVPGLDLSGMEARLSAVETKVDALAAADKAEHDAIMKAVNSPTWLVQVGRFLSSPTGLSMSSALGGFLTYYLTHQAPSTSASTPAAGTAPASTALSFGYAVTIR